VTVEPRVEDLLASIRRAIDDEDAAQANGGQAAPSTSRSEQGKLMRGSMREMRVNVEPVTRQPRDVSSEIEDIRAKVDRNFAEASKPRPAAPSGPFANIMTGQRREPPQTGYPPLRGTSHQEDDYDAASHAPRHRQDYAPPPDDGREWDNRDNRGALMSQRPAQSAQSSFDHLAESMMARIGGDRTVEEITRELLRGMLRQWLDDNLPPLVERLVREEIERVARRGR
jgi:uncharacterized protein